MTEHASFLRLERYRLRELSALEAHAVSEHLTACDACRACLAEVEREVQLPALVVTPLRARPRSRALRLGGSVAGALALAAAALLVVRSAGDRQPAQAHVPPARLSTKGGETAIELVRKHGDALAHDSAVFVEGDAFKVLLTCPAPLAPHFEVVVYQAGEAFFPLSPGVIERCGNRRTLAGAFSLDGPDEALVCVALDAAPLARATLRRGPGALPELSVCTRVRPGALP